MRTLVRFVLQEIDRTYDGVSRERVKTEILQKNRILVRVLKTLKM